MSPRTLIAAVVALASTTLAPTAFADGKNEIRAVTFDESSGTTPTTNVHVRGADTPTFTVYKLERPARIVVDIPQARLSETMRAHDSAAVLTPNTWAVSTIAAQQLDDNAVRVVVTMARPGRYDVKTLGNEVIVMVMPRDAAPKATNPEELVRAQQQASAAETARAAAQQQATAANATAKQSRAEAEAARADADRLRQAATAQAAKAEAAQRAVDQATHASSADLEAAKATAAKAKQDAAAAKAAAASAQLEAERTHKMADQAKQAALAEAAAAKAEVARAHGEAAAAQQALAQTRADARQARDQLAAAQQEVASAKSEAAKRAAEVDAAQKQVAAARAEAQQHELEATTARDQIGAARAEAAANATAATTAKSEAANAKADAARARHEAELAKSDADAARVAAAHDKKKAEAARGDAERMIKDAKAQLATLDHKMASAQSLEDKARATSAAAEAREAAARDAEATANRERAAAELVAQQAQHAQTKVTASERAQAAADAKAAGDRLAEARRATEQAEGQRHAAEAAAEAAKHELEQTRSTLASVEQQRSTAVAAATEAARKRSDAEAAALDAARRRGEAETAATEAAKQKKAAELAASDAMQKKSQAERDRAEAEAQRVAALDAARSARAARDAADKQRKVSEQAAETAVAAKASAERSLAELTTKQAAAEHAAAELEARSKAEATAQAQVATLAAQTRKASEQELAKAKAELTKLSADRTRAEDELADRRKAVAHQQAEAARLATAATQAHDAASREEARRAQLAQKRTTEEAELARIASAKADAEAARRDALAAKAEAAQVKAQVAGRSEAPAKLAKVSPDRVSRVTAVDFKGSDGNGQVSIAVDGGAEVQVGEVTATHAELIVDNAELAHKLERTLDVSRFGSPVRTVSTFHDRRTPNRIRLVAELAQAATPTVERDGNAVRWHFIGNEIAKRPVRVTNVPSPIVGGFGAASTPLGAQTVTQLPAQGSKRRVYHGAVVDLDVKDAPLHDLLRLLADTGHISIVVPESIDPKITVKLKRVPWDQALEVILQSYGLWYRRDGTIFRVASQKDLDSEDAAEAARRDAAIKSEAPRVERVNLNYANASELKPTLETLMSPHGKIEVDKRTNALIINDVAANRAEIARLAYELDTQTPQISIEARIVEARSTFLREIGVQWGGNAIAGAAGGNATGLIWPSSVGITGANSDSQTNSNGVAAPSDFAVNLPAATGTGEGGALGFSLGSIGGNFNINLRLSALEDSGNVRIISAPKVTVLNNKEAKISQGVSIPISVVSAAGTNTQFVQADLALTVTPSVSQRDCAIAMTLNVTKNEPDFVNVGARGDPTILRKEARTQMLVADGETTVLGGIYTRNSGIAYKKVPLLGDIPVLGWLFKNRRENDDRTEILVFITPKITNRGSLPCMK